MASKQSASLRLHPSLSEAIVNAFDDASNQLKTINFLSKAEKWVESQEVDVDENLRKILETFERLKNEVPKKSSDVSNLIDFLHHVHPSELEIPANARATRTNFGDFYSSFKKLRDHIEEKLTVPLKDWEKLRDDDQIFTEEDLNCQNQLEAVRLKVEKARVFRDQKMPMEIAEEEKTQKVAAGSEDFRSRRPFAVAKNALEVMDYIETFAQKRLAALRDELEREKAKIIEYQDENWPIVEKVMEIAKSTGRCIQWLLGKHCSQMMKYQIEFDELWAQFSKDMEKSRSLCKHFKELEAPYTQVLKEREEQEILKKEIIAVVMFQSLWRGYMVRKRFKKKLHREEEE